MKWPKVELSEFVDAGEMDLQTGPFGTQLRASDYSEDGTPVINVRNIGYGNLRPDKLEFVPDAVVTRLGKHILETDDIVFGRKGAVDRHLLVSESETGWMQGSDCLRLRLSSKRLLPEYLSFAFRLNQHKQWMLNQCGNKATMASLNQDVVNRIQVRLPPPPTQAEIADKLSAYDDSIENNRRRIELLEQSARLLYKEWFVHLRFPGHEHITITNGIPDGWEKKTLKEVAPLHYGKALRTDDRIPGEFPVYGSSGIVGTHEKALVTAPAIVVGRKGNVGSIFRCPKDFHPIDTVYFIKTEDYSSHLLYALEYTKFINTDVAVPGLNRDFAHSRKLLVPSTTLRLLFEEHASTIHCQIDSLTLQNEKLAAARDLLLPRLMNGEIAI